MNSNSLENFIKKDEELSLHKDYLDALVAPSVDISFLQDEANDDESRFGGFPFVSDKFVWPSHEKGEYRFLGQINFSEIDACPEVLPSSGLLSLFYAFDEDGEIFWGDDGYVLGYYWPKVEDLSISAQVRNSQNSKRIMLKRGDEIPRHKDLRKDWPFDTGALYDLHELDGFCEDYMLGYPSFCSLAYDPTPGDEWVSLITLSSYDEFEWCWHDGDKLMVFIEKTKLKNGDFSNLKTDAG